MSTLPQPATTKEERAQVLEKVLSMISDAEYLIKYQLGGRFKACDIELPREAYDAYELLEYKVAESEDGNRWDGYYYVRDEGHARVLTYDEPLEEVAS